MAALQGPSGGSCFIDVIDASMGRGGRGLMLLCQTRVLAEALNIVLSVCPFLVSPLPTSPRLPEESLAPHSEHLVVKTLLEQRLESL